MPGIDAVNARPGKLLRTEPIAQQMVEDRVRLRGTFVDLEKRVGHLAADRPGLAGSDQRLVPTAPQPGQYGRGPAASGPAYGRRDRQATPSPPPRPRPPVSACDGRGGKPATS